MLQLTQSIATSFPTEAVLKLRYRGVNYQLPQSDFRDLERSYGSLTVQPQQMCYRGSRYLSTTTCSQRLDLRQGLTYRGVNY